MFQCAEEQPYVGQHSMRAGLDPVDYADFRLILRDALQELSPKQQWTLYLYAQGYSQREIGETVGKDDSTVSRWLFRACDSLRGAMNGAGTPPDGANLCGEIVEILSEWMT